MSTLDPQTCLPTYQGKPMVSLLYLITSPTASILGGDALEFPAEAQVVVFSDRPVRAAQTVPGGIRRFAEFFAGSDFTEDPPNVTFAATADLDGRPVATVLELGTPVVAGDRVRFPVLQAIGSERMPPDGAYATVSCVVDDFNWDILGDALSIGGTLLTTVAAGAGTLAACTVGEVATAGTDTPACALGVAATIGAGTAAAGAISHTIGEASS